jgi:uncharacterized protein
LIRYFDASALAKRYILEPNSRTVDRLLAEGIATTGRLSEAEIASALARRHREGSLNLAERDHLLKAMQQDLACLYVVEISPEVSTLACSLLMRHKLRASDSLHLASALVLKGQSDLDLQFIGFDDNLNEAARLEGLDLLLS